MTSPPTLLLVSKYALYPPHWRAMSEICNRYSVRAAVIAAAPPELPAVHQQLGWIDLQTARDESFAPDIRLLPETDKRKRRVWLAQTLAEIQPDAIWLQQEPTESLSLDVLRVFRHDRRRNPSGPRIVSAVCENIFRPGPPWRKFARSALWSRLDTLLATSQESIHGIRHAGMPRSVPAETLVAGMEGPPDNVEPLPMPVGNDPDRFLIGFAGRICHEKGWKVLLEAIRSLDPRFCVALAGSGPQDHELKQWCEESEFRHRVHHVGLLPKADLWRFYQAVDCLVLPSLTLPRWKEQFGGVLADAMAMGLPIVGSDSGAIPEVIGPAGRITPEGDSQALAAALIELDSDRELAARIGHLSRTRFDNEFSIPAYARKIASSLRLPELHASKVA
ncbi:glycosyltransferase [Stieleria sp. TO1_6]|uniref:glycosyltransferase family 4 protein n=1 Tax=Stieleria tagensis TaxID=2956795 RepID=UPI00209B52E5|nr:glycosyltransferase [Stieleria tagensis]MCO8120562.1 glycosyltransferase [Stieleria tagensis]